MRREISEGSSFAAVAAAAAAWDPKKDFLLEIENLSCVSEEDNKEILKGVNLKIKAKEIHAIMGRNGSGKSTLSKVLAGSPSYRVTSGHVAFKGVDLLQLGVDQRALLGLFLAFQYPLEVPMVSCFQVLKTALQQRAAAAAAAAAAAGEAPAQQADDDHELQRRLEQLAQANPKP
ncbi:ABC transporter, putative [Eimeria tenella]|uniref:ABC transporter, putative n=1 Tax=Eimeria tenella TaxID=5802 RepID=U6KME0_EIMTE|nr:ABC transporter, putative [Eimeria tenella]CDJ39156.1 ABC transporter, putative [Eimeria tenella]|eukprot:XP_013229911.1 ABC transporter, putative [Eimeria tenella]